MRAVKSEVWSLNKFWLEFVRPGFGGLGPFKDRGHWGMYRVQNSSKVGTVWGPPARILRSKSRKEVLCRKYLHEWPADMTIYVFYVVICCFIATRFRLAEMMILKTILQNMYLQASTSCETGNWSHELEPGNLMLLRVCLASEGLGNLRQFVYYTYIYIYICICDDIYIYICVCVCVYIIVCHCK